MKINNYLLVFITSLLVYSILDSIWLGLIVNDIYDKEIGYFMNDFPLIIPIILFYVIYSLVLTQLVIIPAIKSKHMRNAIINGALFGLVAYATYDLTNLATIKYWTIFITVIDMIWEIFVTSITSTICYYLFKKH